jgi:uncharacterized lipoprotein YddW (UPF0748 family)
MTAALLTASSLAAPVYAAESEAAGVLETLAGATLVSDDAASTSIAQQDEVRAIWIAFLDLQKILSGKTEQQFTASVKEMYQNCLDAGLNTVIVQVRPYGDSFYPSAYYPWSAYASGSLGVSPGFDPLSILVEQAHAMGLDFEAWVNPLRLVKTSEIDSYPDQYPVKQWVDSGSDNVFAYNGYYYLNPASEEARQLIVNGVTEIINNYDVDGIHIDDYFYPSSLPASYDAASYAAAGTTLSLADWRRENISTLVAEMYSAIKKTDSDCVFGISPRGVIEQDYNLIYADVAYWASHEGYCDYLAPQIYYGFDHATADYAKTLQQWSELTTAEGVSLRIGLAAYKVGNVDSYAGSGKEEWVNSTNILARQIDLSRCYDNVEGTILFRYEQIFVSPNSAMTLEKKNFVALLQ